MRYVKTSQGHPSNDIRKEYLDDNTEIILNELLVNNPFKEVLEQRMGEEFPIIYSALINCIPPELMNNIITYPWLKQIKTEILKEVNFRPQQGELPLFVLIFKRSWSRTSERALIISNKAVYMPKGNTYEFADIYRNYFNEKKGRMYLKNFVASHQWERAAVHLIEAAMLIFCNRRYDGDISGITKNMKKNQAKVIKMSEAGMIKKVYDILDLKEQTNASKRMLVLGGQYGEKKIETLKRQIHSNSLHYIRERLIFAYDLSVAANGKAGMLFTSDGVYIKDIAINAFVSYRDIWCFENTRKDFMVNSFRVVLGKEEDGYRLKRSLQLLIAYYTDKDRKMIDGTRKVLSVHKEPRRTLKTGHIREKKPSTEPEIKSFFENGLGEENRKRLIYSDNEEQKNRLAKLCRKISSRYPQITEEKIFFAIDSSLIFDGKSGIIAGENGIYFCELNGMNFISYKNITTVMRKSGQIYVNGERIYVFGRKDIVLIAGIIMQLTLRHNKGFTTNIDEIFIDRNKEIVSNLDIASR